MGKYLGVTITTKKGNSKLGQNVLSTYRPVGETCPQDCPFLNRGCYAQKHKQGIIQKQSSSDICTFQEQMTVFFEKVQKKKNKPTLFRLHTSGDVMKNNAPDIVYISKLLYWVEQFKSLGLKVINYTHAWMHAETQVLKTFTRASVHSVENAKIAIENGWHTALALTSKQDVTVVKQELKQIGLVGVHCPNQTHKIQCTQCMLCEVKGSSQRVIIFAKH